MRSSGSVWPSRSPSASHEVRICCRRWLPRRSRAETLPSTRIRRQAWAAIAEAQRYERSRPSYAEDAVRFVVERLGIGPGNRILDLGAGTGKLTRQLRFTGASIIALEPLESMRSVLAQTVPGVRIIDGTAEDIPLGDRSVDGVVAGQSWHWFDSAAALRGVSRVLEPGGGLALLWNEYDRAHAWVREYTLIRDEADGEGEPVKDWLDAFIQAPFWASLESRAFPHTVPTSREGLVDRMLSSSVHTGLTEEGQERIRSLVFSALDAHDETRGRDPIEVPYLTEVFASHLIQPHHGPA